MDESEEEDHDEFSWLEPVHGSVKSDGQVVGCLEAKLIRRSQVAKTFLHDSSAPPEGNAQMAFDLFDRHGRLKPEFCEHPYKKGSGVWQNEFNNGELLLVEGIIVLESHSRQGLATRLVNSVVGKCRSRSKDFYAVVNIRLPRLSSELDEVAAEDPLFTFQKFARHIHAEQEAGVVQFWRKMGFRRIGSSQWFAYASNKEHASHAIPSNKDFELSTVALCDELSKFFNDTGDEVLLNYQDVLSLRESLRF